MIGCGSNDLYKSSYRTSYGTYDDGNAYMSDHEGDPRVLFIKSFDVDLKILTDNNFAVVGKSIFSGPPEDFNEAIKIGKDLKVTHVLLSSNYVYSSTKKSTEILLMDLRDVKLITPKVPRLRKNRRLMHV